MKYIANIIINSIIFFPKAAFALSISIVTGAKVWFVEGELFYLILTSALILILSVFYIFYKIYNEKKFKYLRLKEISSLSSEGYFCWHYGQGIDAEKVINSYEILVESSKSLSQILNLKSEEAIDFEKVLEGFSSESSSLLYNNVTNLKLFGTSFSQNAHSKTERQILKVTGQRLQNAKGKVISDILWIKDITDDAKTKSISQRELDFLKNETEILTKTLNLIKEPAWVKELDGNILYYNNQAQKLDSDFIMELTEEGCFCKHIVINDGNRLLYEITQHKILLEGRELLFGSAEDLTQIDLLKKTRDLDNIANKYVLERLVSGIAIFDSNQKLTFYNESFESIWKLEKKWLSNEPSYGEFLDYIRDKKLLPEVKDYSSFKEEEQRRFDNLSGFIEELIFRPDESEIKRWIFPYPKGGLLFVFENVSQELSLKRSYNELVNSYVQTIENLSQAIAIFGANGRLRIYNKALLELWGLSSEFCMSNPALKDFIEAKKDYFLGEHNNWESIKNNMISYFKNPEVKEVEIKRNDGKILKTSGIYLSDGSFFISYTDVSEQTYKEKALEKRADFIKALNTTNGNVTQELTYKIKQPFNESIILAKELEDIISSGNNYLIKEKSSKLKDMVLKIEEILTKGNQNQSLLLDSIEIKDVLEDLEKELFRREKSRIKQINIKEKENKGWIIGDKNKIVEIMCFLIKEGLKISSGIDLEVLSEGNGEGLFIMRCKNGILLDESKLIGGDLESILIQSLIEMHSGSLFFEADGIDSIIKLKLGIH